ncbi:hypothetical protein [Streptomyces sp. CC77]|uniref:hypothetical protein n=1 Tax=Streptomyces sp. CC77 TaxID=1906739 RepID=UPI0008DE0461|nr:hypothetical protein [Streptomyces sp. CC77]OII59752.1 hypothetical protein BJP39_11585 [Streptomyces sp. CC77]
MTGHAPEPEPLEHLERFLHEAFTEACAALRERGGVPETIRAYRPPRPEMVGSVTADALQNGFRGSQQSTRLLLEAMEAECAVHTLEAVRAGGQRVVVAVAVWPRRNLSALRIAALRADGTLEHLDTGGLSPEDAGLDTAWLRACLPGGDHAGGAPGGGPGGAARTPATAPGQARVPRGGGFVIGLGVLAAFGGAIFLLVGLIGLASRGGEPKCGRTTMTPGTVCRSLNSGESTTYEEMKTRDQEAPVRPSLIGGAMVVGGVGAIKLWDARAKRYETEARGGR